MLLRKCFFSTTLAALICVSSLSHALYVFDGANTQSMTPQEELAALQKKAQSGEITMAEYLAKMPLILNRQSQQVSEHAGNAKKQHEQHTYDNLSVTGKLTFLLDKEQTPDLSLLKSLIANNANVNHVSKLTKETPLHFAAKHGHLAAVKLLVKSGANITVYNWKGWTASQIAEGYGYKDITMYMDPQKSEMIYRQNTVRAGAQQFIGNWQVEGNPNHILKIRRDKTLYVNHKDGNCECVWSLNLNPRRGTTGHFINYSKPTKIEFDSKGTRIHNNFSTQKVMSINFHADGEDWYISTVNGQERLIKIEDDEDMYYRDRTKDDVITRKMVPPLSFESL